MAGCVPVCACVHLPPVPDTGTAHTALIPPARGPGRPRAYHAGGGLQVASQACSRALHDPSAGDAPTSMHC